MKIHDKELQALRQANKILKARNESLLRDKKSYRMAAMNWKVAYDELNQDFMQANRALLDLVNMPLGEIERVIKAYKEKLWQ